MDQMRKPSADAQPAPGRSLCKTSGFLLRVNTKREIELTAGCDLGRGLNRAARRYSVPVSVSRSFRAGSWNLRAANFAGIRDKKDSTVARGTARAGACAIDSLASDQTPLCPSAVCKAGFASELLRSPG